LPAGAQRATLVVRTAGCAGHGRGRRCHRRADPGLGRAVEGAGLMYSETPRRTVGAVRPSHLMFTSGVGTLVDLPNLAVLVRGLADANHAHAYGCGTIVEPRLLAQVRNQPDLRNVKELRPAPWTEGLDLDPGGPAAPAGVRPKTL